MNLPSRTANPSVPQSRHGWLGSGSCRHWMYYISSRDQRQIQSGRSVILSWTTGSLFMLTALREGSVQNRQRQPENDSVVGLGTTTSCSVNAHSHTTNTTNHTYLLPGSTQMKSRPTDRRVEGPGQRSVLHRRWSPHSTFPSHSVFPLSSDVQLSLT